MSNIPFTHTQTSIHLVHSIENNQKKNNEELHFNTFCCGEHDLWSIHCQLSMYQYKPHISNNYKIKLVFISAIHFSWLGYSSPSCLNWNRFEISWAFSPHFAFVFLVIPANTSKSKFYIYVRISIAMNNL